MGDSSFSLTTFSPSGKLVQIEHALAAVNSQGRPALGLKARNGVVLATEKKLLGQTGLLDESTVRKVEPVDDHIGVVYAGMPADYRVILARTRREAVGYWHIHRRPIPVRQLVKKVAGIVQEFTQSGGVRPFGVSLLFAGYDDLHGFQLYQVDPSGAYFGWKATALGRDSQDAKTFLEKRHNDSLELDDAIHVSLLTVKEGFEGVMDEKGVEVGVVNDNGKFRVLTPPEVKDYLSEVE